MSVEGTMVTRRRFGAVAALGVLAAGCSTATTVGGPAVQSAGQPAVARPVQVEMGEFLYRPQTIRLRGGQPATLAFTNKGAVMHEVMIGKHVQKTGGYEDDFFHDVPVQATGTKYKWEAEGHADVHGAAAAKAEDKHAEDEDEHNDGEGGASLVVEAGGQATLTFTVPADRKGTWEVGCFVPGHYQAGMKGALVVE